MTLCFSQGSRDIVFDQFSQTCLKGMFTSAASLRCRRIAPELLETLLWLRHTFPGPSSSVLVTSPIRQVPSTEIPSLPFLLSESLLMLFAIPVLKGSPSPGPTFGTPASQYFSHRSPQWRHSEHRRTAPCTAAHCSDRR